jgi:uridine phosphorylase
MIVNSSSITCLNSCADENGDATLCSLESRPVEDTQPIHLRPTAPLAERVLLPDDPGRALALAQLLIEQPKMFNHHRGLWGYTGPASADGEPLTIQSTGIGGPSAAIVLHELIALGARQAIRIGACGALDPALELGDIVVACEAIAADGTSAALSGIAPDGLSTEAPARTRAHPRLAGRLGSEVAAGERRVRLDATIASTDLFYETDPDRAAEWRKQGAIAVEMETSALFAVGERARIQVACLLAVGDVFDADGDGDRVRIDDHRLMEYTEAMGRAALTAFVLAN